jgi:glycosyltransferase involved in cell wall biosynthesis
MKKLTVILPVYNGEKFLAQSLDSILAQTYNDFFFFVIDDGSTDGSAEIIKQYQQKDSRIVFFAQQNHGLIETLNFYFSKAETEFIARMDADDISLPERFQAQLDFLNANPKIGILGTGVRYMNENLSQIIEESLFPESHHEILWKMLYTSGFSHPSIMLRKDIFVKAGGYSKKALYVEDYDFFIRARKYTRFANLQQTLFIYRDNEGSVSHVFSKEQKLNHFNLSKELIQILVPTATDDDVRFLKYNEVKKESDFDKLYSFLEQLSLSFSSKYNLERKERLFVMRDWIRKLKVLSLSIKGYSFWIAIKLYFRTLLKAPIVVLFDH